MGTNNRHVSPGESENLLSQHLKEQQQISRAPSRQAIADAAKHNFVKGGRFIPPAHSSLPTAIPAPRQKRITVPTNESKEKHPDPRGPLWEESTIGSALDESLASVGDGNNQKATQSPIRNNHQGTTAPLPRPEKAYYTIEQNGRFTLAEDQQRSSLSSGLHSDLSRDAYASPSVQPGISHTNYFSEPGEIIHPQPRNLTRNNFPLREREAKYSSYVEKPVATSFPTGYNSMGNQISKPTRQSATITYEDAATKAFTNPRSTMFQFSSDDGMADADDSAIDEEQCTPRAVRSSRPKSSSKRFLQSPPQFSTSEFGLRESSLPKSMMNTFPNRERERGRKRKNPELDYDEASLKRMDYSNLRDEPFDFDPATGNSPSLSMRSGTSLLDRLHHFSSKDVKAQADFFKTMTVDEWEEAGDWFLGQFGDVVNRLKQARHAKRKICRDFETEIEKRHQQVAGKMQIIDYTLQTMKSEGEIMMKDKVID